MKFKGLDVHLTVNGKDYDDLNDDMTVSELLAYLSLPEKKIAVERNREIVSKSTFNTTILKSGDTLEIIHFIGGG
ncbi:sulfur carrier protein ThiS [Fretibacter rubidus]|uniref:sulfur carrier protein ThiS n=1 Tax=Fretibacter rubidus TaxID=570162 RepID=UPI00352A8387